MGFGANSRVYRGTEPRRFALITCAALCYPARAMTAYPSHQENESAHPDDSRLWLGR
jgi:hypothetical protein